MPTPAQLEFIKRVNKAVTKKPFGQITVNVIVKDKEPILPSVRITSMVRRRYKIPKTGGDISVR
jgi:glutamate formiminotransferase